MSKTSQADRTEWFRKARFGMFIHWGLYSIAGRDMWYYWAEEIPKEEYEKLFYRFNPVDYDPDEWARLAKEAGMKYAVITTKHHDGFCLWDTELTDFKVTNTPYGKDVIEMWVKAFRRAGLRIGFYYSLLDWHHPHYTIDAFHPQRNNPKVRAEKRDWNKYVEYVHGQIRELITKYGKIDILWFDLGYEEGEAEAILEMAQKDWFFYFNERPLGKPGDRFRARELLRMMREINPDILINDRLSRAVQEDIFTQAEQFVPFHPPMRNGKVICWEVCDTINQSWGYCPTDTAYKSSAQLIRELVDIVSKDGNLLLDVGPTPQGRIQKEFVTRLKEIGKWMSENGESIYGAGMSEFTPPPDARYTQKGKTLYLHLFHYLPGWQTLPGLAGKVEHATLLRDGVNLTIREKGENLYVKMPPGLPESPDTVISLKLK